MIDRFEEMGEEDFQYWDKCCEMKTEKTILMEEKSIPRRDEDESFEEVKVGAAGNDHELPAPEPKYGVYHTELVLLSKSSQSRYSQFILDYGINRKEDRLRTEAMKFIECLRNLPEYEPLIEEGTVEAIPNGDEEVKFLKKDITQA
jgi:hypothetical protein